MSIRDLKKPNILILINDQQRALQHWPVSWERKYLPSMTRLKQNGMTFTQATTVACACSASRASLLTGTYPSLNGVVNTLATPDGVISNAANPGGMPLVLNELRPTDPNLARILNAAGYKSVWKGKWHLSNPRNGGDTWTVEDIHYMREAYGFDGWNPKDAGTSESDVNVLGAGVGRNDERYVTGKHHPDDDSPPALSVLEFIKVYDPSEGPFFLVVSLCNPHDIWVAPVFRDDAGYDMDEIDEATSEYGLTVPETWDEDLSFKPAIQKAFRKMETEADAEALEEYEHQGSMLYEKDALLRYINFYAYLQTLVDQQIGKILDALDHKNLTDDTLIIRLADHGEMCLSHGLREKEFVAYDEAIRIPLIFSHQTLFDRPHVNHSPVCNIDIAPTLAGLAGVYDQFAPYLQGNDLTPILDGSEDAVQEFVHYMTDDSAAPNKNDDPGFIRAIRSKDWMYAVYYIILSEYEGDDDDNNNDNGDSSTEGWCKQSGDGTTVCYQYELYDLKKDPLQVNNLAGKKEHLGKQQELHEHLIETMKRNLTAPTGILLPTPGLQQLIAKDKLEDLTEDKVEGEGKIKATIKTAKDSPVTNPIWPTPAEAVGGSIAYRKHVISQQKDGGA